MPSNWVKTPKEEDAWRRAKKIVKDQRNKNYSEFDDKDWGLTTRIAKNIMLSAKTTDRLVFEMANVSMLLSARKKASIDEDLPENTLAVVSALKSLMGIGGQAIAALRKAQDIELSLEEAEDLADSIANVTRSVKSLLDNVR